MKNINNNDLHTPTLFDSARGDHTRALNTMMQVLSVLSKSDAIRIFTCAKDGLKSELDTPKKISLTKKQYYTRLNQLVLLNLVAKDSEGSYHHTTFGSVIYQNYIIHMMDKIKNMKEYEMVDVLRNHRGFKPEEISDFVSKINKNVHGDFMDLSTTITPANRSSVAYTFDSMVSKVLEIVESAQSEILLVGRFRDDRIINVLLQKANTGVQVRILADINTVDTFFENERDALNRDDKNKTERMTVVANPFYPSKVERRYVQVPFCLLVVDGMHVGLEIVDNYQPKKFFMSTFSVDTNLASNMKIIFDSLWKKSKTSLPKVSMHKNK